MMTKVKFFESESARLTIKKPDTKSAVVPTPKTKISLTLLTANPEKYAASLSPEIRISLLKLLDKYYYTEGKPRIPDVIYDRFKDACMDMMPSHPYFKKVGSPIPSRDNRKTKLPYFLPSLDKIYPLTPDSTRWYKDKPSTREWLVMDKLDGMSLLLVYSGRTMTAFTRGDGNIGQNITASLVNHKHIPSMLPNLKPNDVVAVRGELIIPRSIFESKYKANTSAPKGESSARFANSRALIVGAVNQKGSDSTSPLHDAKFIAYELIQNKQANTEQYKPSDQIRILKSYEFVAVPSAVIKDISDDKLQALLKSRKEKAPYDVDGLVITRNEPYKRDTSDRPSYSIAFKDNSTSEQKVVVVKDVIWSITRMGVFAPRVMIEPTTLSGSVITYLTGFNAFFIEHGYPYKDRDKNIGKKLKPIGPSAKIRIVKSGDVIPYIMEVVTPAHEPKMPNTKYVYDDNKVNILSITDKSDNRSTIDKVQDENTLEHQQTAEEYLHFFRKIGALYVGEAIVKKMILSKESFTDILNTPPYRLGDKLGLSPLMANKIHASIHDAINAASLATIGAATGLFGRGVGATRLADIFNAIPSLLAEPINNQANKEKLTDKISKIQGLSYTSAQQIVNKLFGFKLFIQAIKLPYNHNINQVPNMDSSNNVKRNNPISKLNVVFSKIRDKQLENVIINNGGSVSNAVSSKTTHVVVSSMGDRSSKIDKALSLGIPVVTLSVFKAEFKI